MPALHAFCQCYPPPSVDLSIDRAVPADGAVDALFRQLLQAADDASAGPSTRLFQAHSFYGYPYRACQPDVGDLNQHLIGGFTGGALLDAAIELFDLTFPGACMLYPQLSRLLFSRNGDTRTPHFTGPVDSWLRFSNNAQTAVDVMFARLSFSLGKSASCNLYMYV